MSVNDLTIFKFYLVWHWASGFWNYTWNPWLSWLLKVSNVHFLSLTELSSMSVWIVSWLLLLLLGFDSVWNVWFEQVQLRLGISSNEQFRRWNTFRAVWCSAIREQQLGNPVWQTTFSVLLETLFQDLNCSFCHSISGRMVRCRLLVRDTILSQKLFKLRACETSSVVHYNGIWNSKLSEDSSQMLDSDFGCCWIHWKSLYPFWVCINQYQKHVVEERSCIV